jgi:hypothetical protein
MSKIVGDKWDAAMMDHLFHNRSLFYDVMMAARELEIDPLLDLCAAKIATIIKGKTVADIAQLLES